MKQFLKRYYSFFKQFYLWKHLRKVCCKHIQCSDSTCSHNLVIIPCDPETVGGSRGDEAMIMAVMQYYKKVDSSIRIFIVVTNQEGINYVKKIGGKPISTWDGAYPLKRVYNSILETKPREVVILGADCMDGYYSPYLSLMILAFYDLFKASGITTYLLGFSFNMHPSALMLTAFRSVNKNLVFRLRDAVSLERFKKKTFASCELVADAAFLLQPDYNFPEFSEFQEIVEKQRSIGKQIIGFNFHPMLKNKQSPSEIMSYTSSLAKYLVKILDKHQNIFLLLIPHDDRSRLSDTLVLDTIDKYLSEKRYSSRYYYRKDVFSASQLKALCSLLDGLISSRMHLAIAALGQEKPVMAATYQGKFEGLFKHFDLDENLLLSPEQFISEHFITVLDMFLSDLVNIHEKIKLKLPDVQRLSEKNLL